MDFDPEEILQIVERIRDAFNRAAEADTGSSQAVFKKVAAGVDRLFVQATDPSNQGQDPQKLFMKFLPSIMQLQMAASQLKREVQNNPLAAQAYADLQSEVQEEAKALLPLLGKFGNLPGFPKLPGMDFGQNNPPQEPPAPPAPKKKKPGKPNGGGFSF